MLSSITLFLGMEYNEIPQYKRLYTLFVTKLFVCIMMVNNKIVVIFCEVFVRVWEKIVLAQCSE